MSHYHWCSLHHKKEECRENCRASKWYKNCISLELTLAAPKLLEALEEVVWVNSLYGRYCPRCSQLQEDHDPTCFVGIAKAAIAEAKGEMRE